MRIVFFGSPDYAVPSLRACLDLAGAEVVAVVTQPDRPRGRSGAALMTPVKQLAVEAGVPVILQPERVRRDTTEALAALHPDVGVVAASGHILPTHLLEAFPHQVVNVHASLLPRHRGASPVSAAILEGDPESGASIMLVVRELDAGPVIATIATPIGPLDTTDVLTDRIARLGALLLAETLPRWVSGAIVPTPQDEALVTYAPKLTKDQGRIDWSRSAEEIARAVRAFNPWPLAHTIRDGDAFSILEALPIAIESGAPSGTVFRVDTEVITSTLDKAGVPRAGTSARMPAVACGSGSLLLLRVQRAGKRPTFSTEYANGDRTFYGARLGA